MIPETSADPAAIGPYTIAGRLGEGGMGTVYLGRAADGQRAAIKLIRPELARDATFRRRFEAEVEGARRVASFCTAAVLGRGMYGDRPYLAIEYIEGPTLYAYVGREGALPPGTLQGLAVGVAAALTAIHAAGLVHRDLKPANVILSITGPRVIDFGIARSLDSAAELTASGVVLGTPGWLAPEQLLRNAADPAADVFTWGCLVAYAGMGRHPYGTGDPVAMASRVLHGEPELDGLPGPLTRVIRSALDKDPAARPTASELLLTLTGGSDPDLATRPLTGNSRDDHAGRPLTIDSSDDSTTRPLTGDSRDDHAGRPLTSGSGDDLARRPFIGGSGTRALAPAHRYSPRLLLGGLSFLIGVALLLTGALLLP
jgi:serine/threonine protein kinase